MWSDPSILLDNTANPRIQQILRSLTSPISIVVRTDSSGTSQIYSAALNAISPAGYAVTQAGLAPSTDGSFGSQVTPSGGSQTPYWCGALTDELQYVTISNCKSSASSKGILFKMADSSLNLQNVTFNCDASAASIQAAIYTALALTVHVTVANLSYANVTIARIEIGYSGIAQQGVNWYSPIVYASPAGVTVSVRAKQEGGYLNTVTTCAAAPTTAQTMIVWVLTASSFQFTLMWTSGGMHSLYRHYSV